MLQLKKYQQRVIDEIKEYFADARSLGGEKGIRFAFMDKLGEEVRPYKPIEGLESTPFICVKVPTGGGKTIIASHALKVIHDAYKKDLNGVGLILWLVPSDAIRLQTLIALKDQNHPYREIIDQNFNSNVKVFTVEEALSGITKADLTENLCIIVASLAAFRREDPNWLKASRDSGGLLSHFEEIVEDDDFLAKSEDGGVINSLENVIRLNHPIVILDEGHNAQTTLSFDMFKRMLPSVILEFTATPRSESNVLIEVHASELKAEKMVKVPLYLTNVSQWQEAIRDGIDKRKELLDLASAEYKETKEYIRPLVLIQAEQDKQDESKIYVDKVKDFLISELKIDKDEIKIKTAKLDEIASEDLLSNKSKVNYIITVNALKEGWDCPFAYILISASKIGSRVAVEQTIGRILRLPNVKEKKQPGLNHSYIYSSTENFSKASSAIVRGLESNGYSKDDLKQLTGPVKREKDSFRKVIEEDISLPLISIKGADSALAFNKDLIGPDFLLDDHYEDFDFNFINDQDATVKIDFNEQDGIVKYVQGKLVLTYSIDDFSQEELAGWLKKNVQNRVISGDEMATYIDKVLDHQLSSHTIQALSIHRYKLKEAIENRIKDILAKYGKITFDKLASDNKLTTDEIALSLPDEIAVTRTSPEYFSKHLYERAAHMNGEETDFAFKLNNLDNIAWWFRNREKEDFYLQGWVSRRFYPDYIAMTKSGKFVVIEYKGEDRLSNEDTSWKHELGRLWEKLSDKNHFYLVGKANAVDVIKAITLL